MQDLSGQWQFQMGTPEPGPGNDLPAISFESTIALPGTTETRQKGPETDRRDTGSLTRRYRFDGPAWYRRTITIPDNWAGKRVTLSLERTKYTKVWLDDRFVGDSIVMSAPQTYVIGQLEPGDHTLTILVDNRPKIVESEAHLWSDNTQGNWNGILGEITLRATDYVWIDTIQVDTDGRFITVTTQLGGSGEDLPEVAIHVPGIADGAESSIKRVDGALIAECRLRLPDDAPLWDEFSPNLHEVTVRLNGDDYADDRTVRFGLLDFDTRGSQFTANGRATFLRGKHDACVFPLTGHPPMEKQGWIDYFETCKQCGLNFVRFHSWCPPRAAFEAADEVGIYLQPELPFWGDFTEEVKVRLQPEAEAILRAYGNHPSFVLFALGNENRPPREVMAAMLDELRTFDGDRRLYSQGVQ